jgi:ankyrin repeat protein
VTFTAIDDVPELFRKVGVGNAAAVAEMLRYRPELARCRNSNGLSVVRFARYMRQPEILKLLVEAGPPIGIFDGAAVDDAESVRAALSGDPALASAFDAAGRSALHIAAAHGAVSVIDVLAGAGASLDALSRDEQCEAPLHAAVERQETEAARSLLRLGCDPNARRRSGITPLMAAASQNSRELVELLIAANVNVDVKNEAGSTASDIAASRGHLELAARLRLGERYIERRLA